MSTETTINLVLTTILIGLLLGTIMRAHHVIEGGGLTTCERQTTR